MAVDPRGARGLRVAALLVALLAGLSGCSAVGDQGALTGGPSGPTSAPASSPPSAPSPGSTRASGSPSGSASGAASPSRPSASPSPTQRRPRPPGPPRPVPVKGYTLVAGPKGVQNGFAKLSTVHKGVFDGVTVRTVRRKGGDLATLILMGVRSDYAGRRAVGQRILPGIIAGMGQGAKVERRTIGRQPYAVSTPKGSTLVGWYRGGVLVLVLGGSDAGPVVDYSRAYIVAT